MTDICCPWPEPPCFECDPVVEEPLSDDDEQLPERLPLVPTWDERPF